MFSELALVLFFTFVMFFMLGKLLQQDSPAATVGYAMTAPSFLVILTMDAYMTESETGRVSHSRLFFIFNILFLLTLWNICFWGMAGTVDCDVTILVWTVCSCGCIYHKSSSVWNKKHRLQFYSTVQFGDPPQQSGK